jgi:hypothetical protein
VAPADQPVVAQGNTWRRLLNLIMQLRKVVNHPFMMPDSEPRGDGTSTLQELLDASGGCGAVRLLTLVCLSCSGLQRALRGGSRMLEGCFQL